MKKMKKIKTGKIVVICLASAILIGGIGAVGGMIGYKKGQDIVDKLDLFTDVKVVDQTKEFTGEIITHDITIPKNATETHTITKEDKVILDIDVKAVGVYNYEYVVVIGKATRNFKASLTIEEKKVVDDSKPRLTPRMVKVSDTEYKVSATITPVDSSQKLIDWSIAFKNPTSTWANGKDINQYINLIPSSDTQSCNIKCLKSFGSEIVVNANLKANSLIKGSVSLGYEKKIVSHNFNYTGGNIGTADVIFNNSYTFSDFTKDKSYGTGFEFVDYGVINYAGFITGFTSIIQESLSNLDGNKLPGITKIIEYINLGEEDGYRPFEIDHNIDTDLEAFCSVPWTIKSKQTGKTFQVRYSNPAKSINLSDSTITF